LNNAKGAFDFINSIFIDREFWEARNQWYKTWNQTRDDNALQVDYIRVYAATATNSRNEIYNVGGQGSRFLWQKNCTFVSDEIKQISSNKWINRDGCGDDCLRKDCNAFYKEKGNCVLIRAKNDSLPIKKYAEFPAICGYIPSRFHESETKSSLTWLYVLIPCFFIFLIIAAVLFYNYKVIKHK